MTSLLPSRLPKEEPKPESVPLTTRQIVGNLVFTGSYVIAWHKATLVQWPFRPDEDRQAWMLQAAGQYAQLTGHRVYERVTTRPFPITEWAQRLDARTPNPTELPGGEAWPAYLERQQRLMYGAEMAEKEVYIGVRFSQRDNLAQLAERFGFAAKSEQDRISREADRVASILRGGALNARPCTGAEMAWLMHRSISLGLPKPYDLDATGTTEWVDDDLAALTDGVFFEDSRFGRTVKITSRRADRVVSKYVAVVALGQMTGVNVPEVTRAEWLYAPDSLPFPVERVSFFDVLDAEKTRKHVKGTLLALRDQQKHYQQHELDVPDDLARKAALAKKIDADLTDGQPATAVRFVGFHRLAVAGDTEEETMRRVRQVQDLYRNRIAVHLPPAQGPLLREFIPGEKPQRPTHLRRYPVLFHTAGAPLATGDVGDRIGTWIGTLDGSTRRPVMFDPWRAPEVLDSAGMYPVLGTLGAGKSALIVKMVDQALRRGCRTVVFDPSVTFAGMAAMDRWRDQAQVVDLHNAPAGVLNPWAMVDPPNPRDYRTQQDYDAALGAARGERRQLVHDVITRLIPPQYRQDQTADMLVRSATKSCEDKANVSLWDVVDFLADHEHPQAKILADLLSDVNDGSAEGRLFFPPRNATVPPMVLGGKLLTVITIGGLQIPAGGRKDEEQSWTIAERIAVPALMLATAFAAKLIYGGSRHVRKLLVLDEMHVLAEWPSGRALFKRLARDSRKFDVAVFAAGQNPNDALSLQIENLIGGAFVGRIKDAATAREALRLLHIEDGGYEDVVMGLSPKEHVDLYREFLFLDPDGRVGKISVSFEDDPELLKAVNTRPGEPR